MMTLNQLSWVTIERKNKTQRHRTNNGIRSAWRMRTKRKKRVAGASGRIDECAFFLAGDVCKLCKRFSHWSIPIDISIVTPNTRNFRVNRANRLTIQYTHNTGCLACSPHSEQMVHSDSLTAFYILFFFNRSIYSSVPTEKFIFKNGNYTSKSGINKSHFTNSPLLLPDKHNIRCLSSPTIFRLLLIHSKETDKHILLNALTLSDTHL